MYVTIPLDDFLGTAVCLGVGEKLDHLDKKPVVDRGTGQTVYKVTILLPKTLPDDTLGLIDVEVVGRPDVEVQDTVEVESFRGIVYEFTGTTKSGSSVKRKGITFKADAVRRAQPG